MNLYNCYTENVIKLQSCHPFENCFVFITIFSKIKEQIVNVVTTIYIHSNICVSLKCDHDETEQFCYLILIYLYLDDLIVSYILFLSRYFILSIHYLPTRNQYARLGGGTAVPPDKVKIHFFGDFKITNVLGTI